MSVPEDLQDFLAVSIAAGLKNPAASARVRYRVPASTVSKQLRLLVERGVIVPTGKTRSRSYTEGVFEHYTAMQDDYAFAKTDILVNLARTGTENLVSRSQAKRLLSRSQQFRELILDFDGVDLIGPAFADEIFRVFRAENPTKKVRWINARAGVERMIKRAITASGSALA